MNKHEDARIVKLGDWHCPYHDERTMTTAIAFTMYLDPDIIIIDEPIDFYAISRFDKDPRRALKLQEEIDCTLNYFNIIRNQFPNKRVILLNSNHMERLGKYLCRRAPELYYLENLKIKELFKLDQFNIEFKEVYVHNNIFVFKHGDFVRKHSGWSAKAECEKEGMSGASGHVHRVGSYNVTRRGGYYKWIECGCLCKLDPDYIKGIPDWQQGLGVVDFVKDKFLARTHEIIDHEILIDRKIISSNDFKKEE